MQWAGTQWKFENCLITRSFMPKSFGLHDYAVYAKNCTFVGVEMPNLGLRDDPSTYAGKDDNAFIKCRFINCEIPESVLAMSVDCVFESCKFGLKIDRNPKKKSIWDEAKAPVKVNAFIAGDSIPNPHLHGKLSVTFFPAKGVTDVGANLPFTQAGGRITVPWSRMIAKINPVGSVGKNASDIPVFAKAEIDKKKPILSPSAPVIRPPAAPGVKEIRSVEDIIATVPIGIKLLNAGKVNPVAIDDANHAFDVRFSGKPATMRIVLEEVVAYTEDGYAYLAKGQAIPVRINGEPLSAYVHARVRKDQSASLRLATKGATMVLHGTITHAAISSAARALSLTVTLDEAWSD